MAGKPTYEELEQRVRQLEQVEIDRKRTEEHIRFLSSVVEQSSEGMAIADTEGNLIYVNQAWIEMHGYESSENLAGRNLSIFHNPEQLINEVGPFNSIVMKNGYCKGEVWHIRKDGKPFPTLMTTTLLKDESGNPTAISGIAKDVTDIKRAEEKLKSERDTLQGLMDGLATTRIGVDVVGVDYKILQQSKLLIDTFGDLTGKLCYENYMGLDIPCDLCPMAVAIKSGKVERAEMLGSDGRHYEILSAPLPSSDGGIDKAIEVVLDITERKLAEETLRESEGFKNTIIESSPDCIKLLDLKGNLTYMSKGGQEKLEIKDITVYLNKNWTDFWQGKDNINARMAVDAAVKGAIGKFQGYSPTETGKPRWWDVVITPIRDSNGEIERLLAVSRDITEQKQMEEHLRQAQKLESIGNLAGGIAHDFNNILSSIIGFTELALDEVEKETSIEDSLQEVYSAGKRAKDLVKQVLAFARQTEEEIKPTQIALIAKEVLKLIRSSIPTTIEIRQNIESDSLVMSNATQLHQIFMNLFTNAAHAMEDEGGILELSLKDIVIDGSADVQKSGLKPGNYIQIRVSDTGAGIPSDIIGSIFDPYFTTKGPGEGTGMGLAMVHGIVEIYGGKITVDSKLGTGTAFAIYLPITRKRQKHRPYESGDLPSGTEKILFVDDELPIAKMGSQTLEHLGYSVTTRTSSVEALELFRSKPTDFDLVITDMTMPNMTGDELAVELMKIRSDIPVILCTGYSKKISEESTTAIGIKAFAYKPIVKAHLAKTVRKVLDEVKDSTR